MVLTWLLGQVLSDWEAASEQGGSDDDDDNDDETEDVAPTEVQLPYPCVLPH